MRAALLGLSLLVGPALAAAQTNFVPILGPAASAPAKPAEMQRVTAQRIALAGSMGSQALLVIDGAAPRAVASGTTLRGVKVISVSGPEAVVEVDGQRHTLRIGAAALSLGGAPSPGGGSQIVLNSDANGHFLASGQINGRGVTFMVDTGATLIALGQDEADRIGLDYKNAPRVGLRTANGNTVGWRVTLNTVRLGDVDVYGVEAVVQPMPMPFVLLGNSFLTRFQMKRENDLLTLSRRF
jgi:aspartyl protease family protein